MKKFIGIAILLLLLAGGAIWLLKPRFSGRLFNYLPAQSSFVASLNTIEGIKLIAKERLSNAERLEEVMQRMEEQWGLQFDREKGEKGGISLWDPPLIFVVPDKKINGLLLALDDSASFVREFVEDEPITKADEFSYVFFAESRRLLGWNEEVAILLGKGEQSQLSEQMNMLFGLGEKDLLKSDHPGIVEISTTRKEGVAWMRPSFLGLNSQAFESAMLTASFEKGQLELDFSAKSTLASPFSSQELLPTKEGGQSYPLQGQLSVNPDALREAFSPRLQEGYAADLMKFLTGRLAVAITDTGSFQKEIITYDYDDNFERVEVKKTIKSDRLLGVGLLEVDDALGLDSMLGDWQQRKLLQSKGQRLQLLDVLEQDLFVKMSPDPEVRFLQMYSDTSQSYLDEVVPGDSSLHVPAGWLRIDGKPELFGLAAGILGEGIWQKGMESALRRELSLEGKGTSMDQTIKLQLIIKGPPQDNFALELLEILLDAMPERDIPLL